MKFRYYLLLLFFAVLTSNSLYSQPVTTSSLLDELTDLKRLSESSKQPYTIAHFTSFDRRSKDKARDQKGWYNNADGFGNEPIPNFIEAIESPNENGIGKYLICDVQGPGAVVRTWTAKITGDVTVYLDNMESPIYSGAANPFFINTYDALTGNEKPTYDSTFTQFLSGYFPMPFSKRFRIEWTGSLKDLHFYYMQIRKYEAGTSVIGFKKEDISENASKIAAIKETMADPGKNFTVNGQSTAIAKTTIHPSEVKKIAEIQGCKTITELTLKADAGDLTKALRQNVLRIVFDDYTWGQVQAPLGDFFGTAPGINPVNSLPFTVTEDNEMTCRFVMPFKESCTVFIDNYSDQDLNISGTVMSKDYQWDDENSMYFHAKWRIDHGIIATEKTPKDMVYLMANGKGRYVGSAAFLMNPTSVPSSWGNWWGEGDEKVYIDNNKFPTVFGTGSEDYYGYAWSSQQLFDYAYIGQPRNDGPGNRGFVTNYRYHIIDDFPFNNSLDFFMEIFHHDSVPGFSYGRIAYYYGIPGIYDDHQVISPDDVRNLQMPVGWKPKAHFGTRNFKFYEAEALLKEGKNTEIKKGYLWSNNTLLVWKPEQKGETLKFSIPGGENLENAQLIITAKRSPESGSFTATINGNNALEKSVDLRENFHTISRDIKTTVRSLEKNNELVITFEGEVGQEIAIDFFQVK